MAYFLATGLEKMRGAIPFKDSIDDTIGQINRNTMTRVMGMWAVLRLLHFTQSYTSCRQICTIFLQN